MSTTPIRGGDLEPDQDFWTRVVLWISLAESLLPVTWYLPAAIYQTAVGASTGHSLGEIFLTSVGLLALGYTVVLSSCLLTAGLVVFGASLLSKSLSFRCTNVVGAACIGAVVGFVIATPFFLLPLQKHLLVGLATLLGQLGGAWGAWISYQPTQATLDRSDVTRAPPSAILAYGKKLSSELAVDDCAIDDCAIIDKHGEKSNPNRFRFGIAQILILTVWAALLMTLLRSAGLMSATYLPLAATWLVVQTFSLPIIALQARKCRHRR